MTKHGPALWHLVPPPTPAVSLAALDYFELAGRIARNDHAAFEALMRRHNGKLFRIARAILKDDFAAEDAVQDAYLDAYRRSGQFRGEASVSSGQRASTSRMKRSASAIDAWRTSVMLTPSQTSRAASSAAIAMIGGVPTRIRSMPGPGR